MSATPAVEDRPQITLITPPAFELEVFPDRLARVLDAVDVGVYVCAARDGVSA